MKLNTPETEYASLFYRPFTEMELYYDAMLVDRPGKFDGFLPNKKATKENELICLNMTVERPFAALITNAPPNLVAAGGFGCATFAFPLFFLFQRWQASAGQRHPEGAERCSRFSTTTMASRGRTFSITSMRCCIIPHIARVLPRI